MSEDFAVDKLEVAEVPKNNKHNFEFNVDINVINHLGVGLYSSTPAALTELVANAWDADANEVTITISPDAKSIVIEDDGHGMDVQGIKERFLKVGYSRRNTAKGRKSESGKRDVMGRKGIGKLSMFALADNVQVTSQRAGQDIVAFQIDVPELKKSIENHKNIVLDEISGKPFKKGHGTRIELKDVLTGLKTTEGYLRLKLARRFSIIDSTNDFSIILNNKKIKKEDRGFYQYIQFLWAFDQNSKKEVEGLSKNIASYADEATGKPVRCVDGLVNTFDFDGNQIQVSGYIASVAEPKNLGSKDESANMISIFANGRVFAEDVLPEFNSAKYYKNYLVGEIHANFLDDDGIDRATASREAIKKDDPKYRALMKFLTDHLTDIGDSWDDWRIALGLSKNSNANAAVISWLDSLDDPRDKKAARKLMTSIQNASVHSDEKKNEEAKKFLYRGAIIAFEKLKLRKQLDKLTEITDVLSPEFSAIFASLNEVEEAAYAEITKQRLEIVRKFKSIAKDPVQLEKVAQEHLFENLWLLDPSWDRTGGVAEKEKTLTKELHAIDDAATGARLDITYRQSSGRHIVVELKRPEKTDLRFDALFDQVRKYNMAVRAYYEQHYVGQPVPPIDIYLLIAKTPKVFSEADRQSLAMQNGYILTYEQLINDAFNSYQEYLNVQKGISKIEKVFEQIEKS